MRALGIASIGVALAAILVWLLWPAAGGPPPRSAPGAAPGGAASAAEAEPRTTATAAPTGVAALVRSAVETQPSGGTALAVRTVRADTGAAVPGARVLYLPPHVDADALPPPLEELRQHDAVAFLEAVGAAVVSDGEGRAVIRPAEPSLVVGVADGLYGEHWTRYPAGGERSIRMERDWSLAVRVLDPEDRPVAGAVIWAEQTASEPGEARQDGWLGTTGTGGRLELPHAHTLRILSGSKPVALQAIAPGIHGEPVLVDPRSVPGEIVLRIGPVGAVAVRVEEPDGAPLDPRYRQHVAVELEPVDATLGRPIGRGREIRSDGTARFDAVALGATFRVNMHLLPVEPVTIAGPTEPGETISVTLRVPAPAVLVTGRLAFADGAPIAATRFELISGSGHENAYLRTDDEGRFRAALFEAETGVESRLTLRPRTVPESAPLWEVAVRRRIDPGVLELGEVVVDTERELARGRLVGVDRFDPEFSRIYVETRSTDGDWDRLQLARSDIAEDGAFSIVGVAPDGVEFALQGQGRNFEITDRVPFRPGATDLEIPVSYRTDVRVELLLDEPRTRESLVVSLVPVGGEDRQPKRHSGWGDVAETAATAFIGRVPAGNWNVEIRHARQPEPLRVIPGVLIAADREPDPRLTNIDLRSAVRTVWIRAADAAGQPIAEGAVALAVPDEGEGFRGVLQGGAAPLTLTAPTTVWVAAPDHRPVRLDDVFEDRIVALQPAAELDVRIVFPAPLPDGVGCRVYLQPSGAVMRALRRSRVEQSALGPFRGDAVDLDRSGIARLQVRMDAEHDVMVQLIRGRSRHLIRATTVVLDPDRAPGELRVEIPPEYLRAALGHLGDR